MDEYELNLIELGHAPANIMTYENTDDLAENFLAITENFDFLCDDDPSRHDENFLNCAPYEPTTEQSLDDQLDDFTLIFDIDLIHARAYLGVYDAIADNNSLMTDIYRFLDTNGA